MLSQLYSLGEVIQLCLEGEFQLSRGWPRLRSNVRLAQHKPSLSPAQGRQAGEEAEWLRQFLKDIPLWPKPVLTICIHYDNQAAYIGHKILYITVSLNIFIVDIIPLSSCSQMESSLLTLYRQKIIQRSIYKRFKWRAYKLHIEGNWFKNLTLPSQLNGNLTQRLKIPRTKFKRKNQL